MITTTRINPLLRCRSIDFLLTWLILLAFCFFTCWGQSPFYCQYFNFFTPVSRVRDAILCVWGVRFKKKKISLNQRAAWFSLF